MDTENLIKQLNILFVSNHIDRYAFELLRGIADKDQSLQLQQTGVSGSNCCKQCKKEIDIKFRFCSPECKQYYYR